MSPCPSGLGLAQPSLNLHEPSCHPHAHPTQTAYPFPATYMRNFCCSRTVTTLHFSQAEYKRGRQPGDHCEAARHRASLSTAGSGQDAPSQPQYTVKSTLYPRRRLIPRGAIFPGRESVSGLSGMRRLQRRVRSVCPAPDRCSTFRNIPQNAISGCWEVLNDLLHFQEKEEYFLSPFLAPCNTDDLSPKSPRVSEEVAPNSVSPLSKPSLCSTFLVYSLLLH
ncbi:hypothetical protein SKAU_G00013970 [Synaphobranchus kaupii]|uniref:Uncharacterized protein n=1 Tax=Synaphobranchus kaupii TaxID=118154 RepID=A0A9Q1GBT5_SYNKA|nr:hypothetical protein SKAU_G00013970 [Synaphobranchus kaupii]